MRRVDLAVALVAVALATGSMPRDDALRGISPRYSTVALGDTARFYAWWARMASDDVGVGGDTLPSMLPPDVRRVHVGITRLRAPLYWQREHPPSAAGEAWQVGVLYEQPGEALVLWVPTDSTGFPESGGRCAEHRTWFGVLPRARWAAIDLTPHCSETYGPDEIDVVLYWVGEERWPHVEFTWNGPACVPSALFRFEPRDGGYRRVREACAA